LGFNAFYGSKEGKKYYKGVALNQRANSQTSGDKRSTSRKKPPKKK